MKKNVFEKNTSVGFNWLFDPIFVIFLEIKFFHFQKKVLDQVHFKKNTTTRSANTCIFFFAFLKKITMTGSSHFLRPNGQGFTV